MLSEADLIFPDWPAPANVRTLQTTRNGGLSQGSYASLNLGDHVGDDAMAVAANRQLLSPFLPTEPVWMRQVHGTKVVDAGQASCLPEADAAFARTSETVCCVMTADCLPVLLCDRAGTVVAAVHAGWRGLLNGVIEAAVATMQIAPQDLLVWLGPAIGPEAFEVGTEVRDAFIGKDGAAQSAFLPHGEKWLANIYLLATQRLQAMGVTGIYGGTYCTYTEPRRFYSYRRDQNTGRMASLIWLSQK
ncbi:MAG TPA: peptidoglycan editing factor PgeF [Methylophilaceae bacterium]|nr:peptidoglycan editing factor PgeF [Methylophilaceae bacterium]